MFGGLDGWNIIASGGFFFSFLSKKRLGIILRAWETGNGTETAWDDRT